MKNKKNLYLNPESSTDNSQKGQTQDPSTDAQIKGYVPYKGIY